MKGNLSCIMGQGLAAEATVLASMDKINTNYRDTIVQPGDALTILYIMF